jgi:hypothetical protein
VTALPQPDHRPVLEIDPGRCWSRLASTREGILSFSTSGRPITLAVAYAVDEERVIIAMAPVNVPGWRADGSKVSLEIGGLDQDFGRWFVHATGHVRRDLSSLHDAGLLASPLEAPRLGSDPPPHQLTMPLVDVRGFYEPALSGVSWTPGLGSAVEPAHTGPTAASPSLLSLARWSARA